MATLRRDRRRLSSLTERRRGVSRVHEEPGTVLLFVGRAIIRGPSGYSSSPKLATEAPIMTLSAGVALVALGRGIGFRAARGRTTPEHRYTAWHQTEYHIFRATVRIVVKPQIAAMMHKRSIVAATWSDAAFARIDTVATPPSRAKVMSRLAEIALICFGANRRINWVDGALLQDNPDPTRIADTESPMTLSE